MFGGTFDPVHKAHCDIARTALDAASLDRVIFVVAARPPHKDTGLHAGAEERFAMVQAAIAREPGMEASRIELDREGLSYTVDTLTALHAQHPAGSLFLIVGWDSLVDLPNWKDPQGILALARLLAVARPGMRTEAPADFAGRYALLPFVETALSSTAVRERIVAGEPFDHLVPSAVADLIRAKGIYGASVADR